jgi:hypothetical protein
LTCGVDAAERSVIESDELNIVYETPFQALAQYVFDNYLQMKGEVESVLNWRLRGKPTVVLECNREVFEAMSGSPFFSAFAVPRRHLIVVHCSPLNSRRYLFTEIIKHELCHLVLHSHIHENTLPRWLDEGVCQWVSGSFGEILLSGGITNRISASPRLSSLEELSKAFPKEKDALLVAYRDSRRFVEYLIARHGRQSLLKLLELLKTGTPTNEALVESMGKPLSMLEEQWVEEKNERGILFVWIAQYLYEIVFFLGALLLIYASVLLTVRKKRYVDEDEESDID